MASFSKVAMDTAIDRLARMHIANYRAATRRYPRRVLGLGSATSPAVAMRMGLKGCLVLASDLMRPAARPFADTSQLNVHYAAPYVAGDPALESWFDLVVCDWMPEQVPACEAAAVLAECHRVLRPGGVCSIHDGVHWFVLQKPAAPALH